MGIDSKIYWHVPSNNDEHTSMVGADFVQNTIIVRCFDMNDYFQEDPAILYTNLKPKQTIKLYEFITNIFKSTRNVVRNKQLRAEVEKYASTNFKSWNTKSA